MDTISTTHLNQTQTQVLLAMFIADTPQEAKSVAHRSAKTLTAAKALQQLNYVVVGDDGAAVAPAGIEELKTHGYLDDTGETTEFGQRFYQQAVASLNEYHIIHELLLRD